MDTFPFFSLLSLALLFTPSATADGSAKEKHNTTVKGIVGAIVDESSRIGKEETVAMQIALEDFYRNSNQTLVLHIKDSRGEPIQAALAAKGLIDVQNVEAILGLETWEEVSVIADTSNQNQIPVLSFADTIPEWAAEKWPFLLQASQDKSEQMKAIAAIVQSWNWHLVTVLYEDSLAGGVIPHLYDALRDVDAEISQLVALSPFASSSYILKDLEALQKEDCRVFVVHASLSLAASIFESAKKMKMMEKDYIWITTDPITSLVHSINASIISSMEGIVGVKSYFPETEKCFQDFCKKFRRRFRSKHPEEDNNEPGIFAAQAYDAFVAMARAINESNFRGNELLQRVLLTNSDGLSGKVQFISQKFAPSCRFQIINIMGKSYRELGFWSKGLGFSKTIDENATYNSSMNDLGQVFWPGGPTYTPRGWALPTSVNPLRIGVPAESGYKEYVKVETNHFGNNLYFTGLAIEVFKATLDHLPFSLPYNFVPFNGTYDNLVQQIHLKEFDAVVGDVAVVSDRYKYAEFTHPYTETGLMMIVPTTSTSCNAWSFMKPFTKSMWILIAVINIYNGFTVWLIERKHCSELRGAPLNQIGVLFWLSFSTLFSLRGGKLHSNLSRISMVVWLFLALIITQTYTANLASMLTVQRLEPVQIDTNAMLGYCTGSFIKTYLVEVLKYDPRRLKTYATIDEYAQALKSKEIAAAFLEAPLAKVLLARYCNDFMKVGPTYRIGGFGFAFRRGSPLLASMNEALLKVSEFGRLQELEKNITEANQCREKKLEDGNPSLGPSCFRGLFMITGGISTLSLVLHVLYKDNSMLEHRSIWRMMLVVMKHWTFLKSHFNGSVNSSPDAVDTESQA